METKNQIRRTTGEPGSVPKLEDRYAYYRRCQVARKGGQCKAPAMKGRQVCYKHAEQQEPAARCERERLAVLHEASARTGIHVNRVLRDPRARQKMFGVLAQAILDGSIGEDAAGALLHELCNI